MKRVILAALFLLIPILAFAGSIFETSHSGLAEVRVFIVNSASQADLCVYVTQILGEARGKDHIWFYTDIQGMADAKILFVKNPSLADLKVYFVDSIGMAGWKKSHKCRGKFK